MRAVDSSNNAYIAGETGDLLPILHAVQSSFYPALCANFSASGTTAISFYPCSDAFVAALDPSGSGLLFSTYLNGYKIDQALGLGLDPEHNVYVGGAGELSLAAGNSVSSNGAAFVVKLDPSRVPPFFTAQSITNAASFVSELVSPGGLATIFSRD